MGWRDFGRKAPPLLCSPSLAVVLWDLTDGVKGLQFNMWKQLGISVGVSVWRQVTVGILYLKTGSFKRNHLLSDHIIWCDLNGMFHRSSAQLSSPSSRKGRPHAYLLSQNDSITVRLWHTVTHCPIQVMQVMQPLITPLNWYNFQRKSSVTEMEVTTTY